MEHKKNPFQKPGKTEKDGGKEAGNIKRIKGQESQEQ
jgi:ribosome assembly protein RRB1